MRLPGQNALPGGTADTVSRYNGHVSRTFGWSQKIFCLGPKVSLAKAKSYRKHDIVPRINAFCPAARAVLYLRKGGI